MVRKITSRAAHLIRQMIVSCGSTGCVATMKLLESVKETIPYDLVAKIEGYGYRLKAFERLERYADANGIDVIDVADVAKYFGSAFHIDIMADFAGHAGLARFLGEAAGLVTHVLLPLKGNTYENAGHSFVIENAFEVNPNDEGIPCFHLGLIVRVPLTKEDVAVILAEQASSATFMGYLSEIDAVIRIPDEYYHALNCLSTK